MGMDMGRVTACGPFREREREREEEEGRKPRVEQSRAASFPSQPPSASPPSRTLEHDAVTDRHGQRVVAGREGLLAVAEQNLREFPRWMEKWDSRRPWRGEGWLLFPAIFPVLRASRGGVICPSMSDTRCRWTPGVAE
ncbi:hypothetical protein TESG_08627 [Trichophyton tonsurans CBS 112818]|uniref:Uncharacterized protein n=1 Tax=Trichophyton tonsurans (strain CBS 112818) TaxID=647933 RepID=F2S8Y5_TRIT1|nr:hypothetical protein TESG_08627 [Trichophyton tonsurans CBS 112818]